MSHEMAGNLVDKGWPLTVTAHRSRDAVEDFKARGAKEATTPRELAEQSDVVILCVTGSPQVQAVIQGPNGLSAAGKPLLIVECSTSDPSVTVRLAEELTSSGITLIGAPLSRTPADAKAGTLDVMVGADAM